MLRALHVIPSISPRHGGPSVALQLIERALTGVNVEVVVATTDDDGPRDRLPVPLGIQHGPPGSQRIYFRKLTEFYKYSGGLVAWLSKNVSAFDLVHVHGLFSHASVAGAAAARRHGVPYIIRPLGSLNLYGMSARRPLLKRLSLRWIEGPLLSAAAAVHFTSTLERLEAEKAGVRCRAVTLPLGLDLAPFESLPGPEPFLASWPQAAGRTMILFLSRLDPKKGLDLLLRAFVDVKRNDARAFLVIAGAGDRAFVADLQLLAESLGIARDILWVGHLGEREKLAALGAASCFVLPSYSENFGIAAAEALAAGLPTVLTEGVGIAPEVRRAAAGVVVDADAGQIATALIRVSSDDALRISLTENARRLARQSYSQNAMGNALRDLYERVASEARSAN